MIKYDRSVKFCFVFMDSSADGWLDLYQDSNLTQGLVNQVKANIHFWTSVSELCLKVCTILTQKMLFVTRQQIDEKDNTNAIVPQAWVIMNYIF